MPGLVAVNNNQVSDASQLNQYRNLHNGGMFYDLKNYFGAVGDGSTDDTTAVQNWVNTITGNTDVQNGLYFAPAGRYKITNTITFPNSASNFTMFGAGRHSTMFEWNGPDAVPMFYLSNMRCARFEALGLGNRSTTNVPSYGIQFHRGASPGPVGGGGIYDNSCVNTYIGGLITLGFTTGIGFTADTAIDQNAIGNAEAHFIECYFENCVDCYSFAMLDSLFHRIIGGKCGYFSRSGINNVMDGTKWGGSYIAMGVQFGSPTSTSATCLRLGPANEPISVMHCNGEGSMNLIDTPFQITNPQTYRVMDFDFKGQAGSSSVPAVKWNATSGTLVLDGLRCFVPSAGFWTFAGAGSQVIARGCRTNIDTITYNGNLTLEDSHSESGTTALTNSGSGALAIRDCTGGFAWAQNRHIGGLGIGPSTTARISHGSGSPGLPNSQNPVAGDIYFRTDTPSTANQRMYVCTVGGASPTWVGIV